MIEPIDTCGAGDSYIAAFLGARLGGCDLERGMRAGRTAATATCGRLSALPIDGHEARSPVQDVSQAGR